MPSGTCATDPNSLRPAKRSAVVSGHDARARARARSAASNVDAGIGVRRTQSSAGHHQLIPLEQELVVDHVVRHGHRIVAVEAGEAETLTRQVEGVQHATDGQVRQQIRVDELADLVD